MLTLEQIGLAARDAARELAGLTGRQKNAALEAIAQGLEQDAPSILAANQTDMACAAQNGISPAMEDRLRLTTGRIADIAAAVRYVASLEDPVGKILGGGVQPNGLQIMRKTVPLGVVGIIFESRPNVTVDCTALCLKSGNACILRGGKEAIHSNLALARSLRKALESCGINGSAVQVLEDTSRETATQMMRMNGMLDVLIPRGSAGLIQTVVQNATVPVIETGAGNCHIFVDSSADLQMALSVVHNAKTSRPSVCNALETLLVHQAVAPAFLPLLAERVASHQVELRGCEQAVALLGGKAAPATQADWETEYNDYILAVKVVKGLDEAVEHIERYSTRHSEAILTADLANAREFTNRVDSAAVYINASTRFTDGGVFGLGAEIGISTQKLHARGPMGLTHLTSYKYIIEGNGQIRE